MWHGQMLWRIRADAARDEWDRIIDELMALGILTHLDRGALAASCQAYGRRSAAEAALARMAARDAVSEGLIVKTKSGNLIRNPRWSARQTRRWLTWCAMRPNSG